MLLNVVRESTERLDRGLSASFARVTEYLASVAPGVEQTGVTVDACERRGTVSAVFDARTVCPETLSVGLSKRTATLRGRTRRNRMVRYYAVFPDHIVPSTATAVRNNGVVTVTAKYWWAVRE